MKTLSKADAKVLAALAEAWAQASQEAAWAGAQLPSEAELLRLKLRTAKQAYMDYSNKLVEQVYQQAVSHTAPAYKVQT